jgi:hypothetical protein
MKNFLKRNWQIIVIVVLVFCLIKSCDGKSATETQNAKLQEEAKTNKDFGQFYLNQYNQTKDKEDSLKKRSVALEQENNVLEQTVIKSKNALLQLQKASKKPQYINELQPCNDTLQKVYEYSVQKDSACNETINQLDSVIDGKNEIIKNDKATISLGEKQKSYLENANEKNLMAIEVQDKIIDNQKKQVKKESNKKTFWQIVSGILTVLKFIK